MLVILGLIAMAVVCFVALQPHEPKYQGRKLSELLNYEGSYTEQPEATKAVLAIGTNALPFLLAWIQYEPGWRDWLSDNLPSEIDDYVGIEDWLSGPGNSVVWASRGFFILGTNAASAIPALETMMRDTTKTNTSANAIEALGSIGEPAFTVLKAALADPKQINRDMIIWNFKFMAEGHTNTYLPLLVEALTDKDAAVREAATNAVLVIAPHLLPNVPKQPIRYVY